jgi:hypothetical protein
MTAQDEMRLNHYGLSYYAFMKMVCKGCKFPCYDGEERCEKMDRMRRKYGF